MPEKLGLLTGFPGWLTNRFLARLEAEDDPFWQGSLREYRWQAVVAPDLEVEAGGLADGVEGLHVADVRDGEALAAAFRSKPDLVLHAAGIIHPRRISELYSVNRDGTGNVVRLAAAAGVRRLVYISSNAAAGFGNSASDRMREQDPPKPESHYGKSKLAAEQLVWSTVAETETEAVVLRPTTIYGPHFPRRQLRAFLTARDGRPPVVGDGLNAVSAVFIDNLVQCVGLALTVPLGAGNTYFVADEPVYRWRQVFEEIGNSMGSTIRPRRMPLSIAATCAALDQLLAHLDLYAMDVHLAGEAARHMACSIEKAKAELGYRPTVELSTGMRQATRWAIESGWL